MKRKKMRLSERLIRARTIYGPHRFSYMEEIKVRLEKASVQGKYLCNSKAY